MLGIDWGTSNRRSWWLGAAGNVLAEHQDEQGLLACQGRFPEALKALLAAGPALAPDASILMSGMVGSASGWLEAPYVDASTPLAELARHLVPVPAAGPRSFIVPGVRFGAADGRVDVMRGEETQLLGALTLGLGDGWVVLPGTHSKWVLLQGGRVVDLATYMTGELFALLTRHGTLASVTGAIGAIGVTDTIGTIGVSDLSGVIPSDSSEPDAASSSSTFASEPFLRGVHAAGHSGLSNALFGCRALVVTGRMPASDARDYLSGLLIGAEWHDVVSRHGRAPVHITLIGSPELERRYAGVASGAGCRVTRLSARDVQLAAFGSLRAAV